MSSEPATAGDAAQRAQDLWQSGAGDATAHAELDRILAACPLGGRVIHGMPGAPGFGELLASDTWRRLVWVFGPDAFAEFLGRSARGICVRLGFGETWLDEKIPKGKRFKLCVFPSSSVSVTRATWAGVSGLLEQHYPEVWPVLEAHLPAIERMSAEAVAGGSPIPVSTIEALGGYDMEAANFAGRDHATGESSSEHYMSLQRLVRLERPSLVQVRQFLWDEIGLGALYRGDGFTYTDAGERGVPEYLAHQVPLRSIQGAAIIDLHPSGPAASR